MRTSFFVPARSSRHRTAALALYRALVRAGSAVPMPKEPLFELPIHPVARIVRRRFAGNRHLTSLRLVYASMAAGYKFLTKLVKAQTPGSPEHSELIEQLRGRLNKTKATLAANPPPPSEPMRHPDSPFLTNTAAPNEPPKYISTTKPARAPVEGKRWVPTLGFTSEFRPFLRYTMPQPDLMSKVIRANRIAYTTRVQNIKDVGAFVLPFATWEDEWDARVAEQARSEGVELAEAADVGDKTRSYAYSTLLDKLWWELMLEYSWEDWAARGETLHAIMEEERRLAAEEAGEPPAPKPPPAVKPTPFPTHPSSPDANPKISLPTSSPQPLLANLRRADPHAEFDRRHPDPYSAPAWGALVRSQQDKLYSGLASAMDAPPFGSDKWKTRPAAGPRVGPAATVVRR